MSATTTVTLNYEKVLTLRKRKEENGGQPEGILVEPPLLRRRRKMLTGRIKKERSQGWTLLLFSIALLFVVGLGVKSSLNAGIGIRGSALAPVQDWNLFHENSQNAPTCDLVEENEVSFTLVSHLSLDRLWMIEKHCNRWRSDISLAILTNETKQTVEERLMEYGCDLSRLRVQLLPDIYPVDSYPINLLRNRALGGVETSHVLYLDVDFWPTEDIEDILAMEGVKQLFATDLQATIVIPAFQLRRQCREHVDCTTSNMKHMPRNFDELISQVKQKQVGRFDPTNYGGHGSTHYLEWFYQPKGDLLEISCFRSNRYEPYIAFRYCRDLPPFQEQFSGYGKNKMSWIMHLRHKGYTFWQLGGAFAVHYPHLESKSREAWNEKPDNMDVEVDWLEYRRGQMDLVFMKFREWLSSSVPDNARIPLCDNADDDDSRLWYDHSKNISDVVGNQMY